MTLAAYALLFFGALAGGFVSGLAGFGTALMALGIWLYVLPPTFAVPLVLICSVIAQVSTLPSIWKTIDFRLVWPFIIGGLAGVPIGILLIAHADPIVFKRTIGVFLVVFPLLLYFQRKPMAIRFGGKWADAGIGFAGGILGGLAGLSGPLPILWASVRGWGKEERRGICLSLSVSRQRRKRETCGAQVPTFPGMPWTARRRGRMAYFFTSWLA